jgi:hypothetical protein
MCCQLVVIAQNHPSVSDVGDQILLASCDTSRCQAVSFSLVPMNACALSLPLHITQEIKLCGLDAAGRVVQAGFVPLSPRDAAGQFEIVVSQDRDAPLSNAVSAELEFTRYLATLAIGDEMAVRPGRNPLQYRCVPFCDILSGRHLSLGAILL